MPFAMEKNWGKCCFVSATANGGARKCVQVNTKRAQNGKQKQKQKPKQMCGKRKRKKSTNAADKEPEM